MFDLDESPKEGPPLKKFKALFEASHPDQTGLGSLDEGLFSGGIQSDAFTGTTSQTQTQTQTQARGSRAMRSGSTMDLGVLREEEEETQTAIESDNGTRGKKRKVGGSDHEDGPMTGADGTLRDRSGPAPAKRRALEVGNSVGTSNTQSTDSHVARAGSTTAAVGSKPPQQGAPIGQPDTDVAFLKAIASTKRGKKTEDDFDREFNKLKISRPDLGSREEQEKEWTVLEDFGDETNVRGNFMVVVEMDVYQKDNEERQRRFGSANLEWQGKPNFKKFKKVGALQSFMASNLTSVCRKSLARQEGSRWNSW